MATVTGLDAATRTRLSRENGATEGLLDFLESEGFEPSQITAAFAAMSLEQIASRVGYNLQGDPNYRAPAAADDAEPAAPASAPARAPTRGASRAPARRRRLGQSGTYQLIITAIALAFGLAMAALMWRVDGFFGISFLQSVPGLNNLPNTILWPPVWTWLIGLGVSAMQGGFWPHMAKYDAEGELIEEASTPQEIITWLVVLFINIASSALGMMPIIKGMSFGEVVVPEAGWGLWLTGWFFAAVFALYPEWAARVFGGKLWDLLVPDSLQRRIKAMKSGLSSAWRTLISLLPADPRGRIIVGVVTAVAALIVLGWMILSGQPSPEIMQAPAQP